MRLECQTPNKEGDRRCYLLYLVDLGNDHFGVVGKSDVSTSRTRRMIAGYKKPLAKWQAVNALRAFAEKKCAGGYRLVWDDLPRVMDCQFRRGSGGLGEAKRLLGRMACSERGIAEGLTKFCTGYEVQFLEYQSMKYPLALHLAYLDVLVVRVNGKVVNRARALRMINDVQGRGRVVLDCLQVFRDAHDNMAQRIGGQHQALVL